MLAIMRLVRMTWWVKLTDESVGVLIRTVLLSEG